MKLQRGRSRSLIGTGCPSKGDRAGTAAFFVLLDFFLGCTLSEIIDQTVHFRPQFLQTRYEWYVEGRSTLVGLYFVLIISDEVRSSIFCEEHAGPRWIIVFENETPYT